MLYDLLLAKSLNGGGGGGGSAAPLFVEFASDDDYTWNEYGYYEFQNVTCSETPESVVEAVAEGRVIYATFTESHNIFTDCVLDIDYNWKNEDGGINSVTFGKNILTNDAHSNAMTFDQVRIDIYEEEDNPGVWAITAEMRDWHTETYTS